MFPVAVPFPGLNVVTDMKVGPLAMLNVRVSPAASRASLHGSIRLAVDSSGDLPPAVMFAGLLNRGAPGRVEAGRLAPRARRVHATPRRREKAGILRAHQTFRGDITCLERGGLDSSSGLTAVGAMEEDVRATGAREAPRF